MIIWKMDVRLVFCAYTLNSIDALTGIWLNCWKSSDVPSILAFYLDIVERGDDVPTCLKDSLGMIENLYLLNFNSYILLLVFPNSIFSSF